MNIYHYYRLLDLGFEKDVSSILTAVKKSLFAGIRCQTVLLSATLNEGIYNTMHSLLDLDFKNHTLYPKMAANLLFFCSHVN